MTDGVYAWFRHPSYVGWLYWSVGTQLILCNPVSLVAKFFLWVARIPHLAMESRFT